jgi:hypothetical protein
MALLPFQAIWFIGAIFIWLKILGEDDPLATLAEVSFDSIIGQGAFLVFSITPPLTFFALNRDTPLRLRIAGVANGISLLYSIAAFFAEADASNAMILLALFAPVVGILGSVGGLNVTMKKLNESKPDADS